MANADRQQHWLRLFRAWSRSGVSQREFCEQRGVSFGSFTWWRSELRRRGVLERPTRRDAAALGQDGHVAFRPVRVVGDGDVERRKDDAIDVVIDGRHVVRVRGEFDPVTLRRVVAALEDRAC